MLRRFAQGRTSFAAVQSERSRPQVELRQGGARRLAAAGRMVAAVLRLIAAAIAGGVFVVLLPICGIASVAEGIARSCWRSACDALPRTRRDIPSHH
jgi:hypothetical protein